MVLFCVKKGGRFVTLRALLEQTSLPASMRLMWRDKTSCYRTLHKGPYLALANLEEDVYDLLLQHGAKPPTPFYNDEYRDIEQEPYAGEPLTDDQMSMRAEAHEYGMLLAASSGDVDKLQRIFEQFGRTLNLYGRLRFF